MIGGPVGAQPPTFNEAGGVVSLEAESGTVVNRTQGWTLRTNVGGYSGAGFLAAEPNNGTNYIRGFVGVAPEVQFRVRFTQAGTYHVWVRGYSGGAGDDSVHAGLNGAAAKSAAAISEFAPGAWNWSRDAEGRVRTATLAIPGPGVHTINVWMREDGFRFDKLVLTSRRGVSAVGHGSGRERSGCGAATARAQRHTHFAFL